MRDQNLSHEKDVRIRVESRLNSGLKYYHRNEALSKACESNWMWRSCRCWGLFARNKRC